MDCVFDGFGEWFAVGGVDYFKLVETVFGEGRVKVEDRTSSAADVEAGTGG